MRVRGAGIAVSGEGVLWVRQGVGHVVDVEAARVRLALAEACLAAWVSADEERSAERLGRRSL